MDPDEQGVLYDIRGQRRRRRPATVTVLLHGSRHTINRKLMGAYLPRTTIAPRWSAFEAEHFLGLGAANVMDIFPGHIYPGGAEQALQALRAALRIVFQYLERLSEALDANEGLLAVPQADAPQFFLEAGFRLDLGRDTAAYALHVLRTAFAVCVVLDMQRGMGASNVLAEKVGLHLLDLAPRMRMRENERELSMATVALLFAWAKVFRDAPKCVAILKELWEGLGEPERMFFGRELLRALPTAALDSNAERMHRVLVRERLLWVLRHLLISLVASLLTGHRAHQ
jgi:hypothetical protein